MSVKSVKLFCLFGFIGFAVFSFAFSKSLTKKVGAFSANPPPETTGAPGEGTCAQCHIGGINNGQFSIIAPANYTPGQTYQIQVRHTNADASRKRWGFELTALANNSAAGTFTNLTANTQTLTSAQRNYIYHSGTGTFINQTGGAVWTFNWTAPSANVGVVTFYAAGNQANNDNNSTGDQIYTTNTTSQPAATNPTPKRFDFDGDGKADISLFRPTNSIWYLSNSANSSVTTPQWGLGTDKLTPADYDGDGKTDVAVFRDGFWYLIKSGTNTFDGFQWGATNDTPQPFDFDGDGKADISVFRNGIWYVLQSSGGVTTTQWGTSGDVPVSADYDGDGKADYAIFRQGVWWILKSNGGTSVVQWGLGTDKAVPSDYDGDGKADFAVFRNGFWYFLNTSTGFQGSQWGTSTDIPAPADYDGDGKTDLAVFRNGTWYLQRTTQGVQVVNFGSAGDKPIPNSFVQ